MNAFFSSRNIFTALIVLLALSSCTADYGKKVTFPGHKGEVFYKGDGVSEADAKATGKFLEENDFFLKDDKKRSVQITKDSNRIRFRMVIDEKGFANIENADDKFALLGAMMSRSVFNNTPVDVIYTDDFFKDKKTIAFNPSFLQSAKMESEVKDMNKKSFAHNTLYYTSNITDAEADTIVNYLVKSDFFTSTGHNDMMLSKTPNNGAHFKFPVKTAFANEEGMQRIDAFAKQLKADMFGEFPMEFEVLDENLKSLRTFHY